MLKTANVRNTKYFLIQYNENTFRILKNKYQLEKGWQLNDQDKIKEDLKRFIQSIIGTCSNKDEVERVSLIRTKSHIRELALCNNFEYFGTITINNYFCNRYELDDCQKKLKKLFRRLHDKNHDFKYLVITEKHKDGAFHFHGLFSGLDLYCNQYNYFSNYDLDELGFNSFSVIKDYNKCCNYITKYITKDCVKNSHNQLYIRSKGLHFATKEEVEPLIEIENHWKYENDYCCFYDIDLKNINEFEKKLLIELVLK